MSFNRSLWRAVGAALGREGRALLKSLTEHGIQCTYVLIVAASYVMKAAT